MTTLITAVISLPPPIGMMSMVGRKAPKARTFRCLGKEGHHQEVDLSQETYQPSDSEVAAKKNDIRGLFKEAQQNIMFLNKQRLQAIEELNKANREKQDLLDRIEKLEAEKQSSFGRDNHSVCWQLLHRIDSMILNGTINTAEASDLRNMVMSCKFNVADIFSDILPKGDSEVLAKLRHVSDGRKKNTFHVIHICTEMEPLVDGSLASYVRGLSHALQKKGHFVEVILPKYKCLDLTHVHGLREIEAESYSYFDGQLYGNRIWTGVVHGIGVTFIQPLQYSSFFDRDRVSGYADDFERFIYFSRASLDYITKSGKRPDVLHIHNWETSIVGPLFWDIFVNQGLGVTRVLLTCHGFDSQWLEQPDKLTLCGLDPARLHRTDRLQDNSKTHLINVLKGGVVYSNKVIILSSMHSKGRIIRSLSHGLEPTLSMHKDKVLVAPYGFDDSSWDPSKDKFLPQNYSMEDIQGKFICRNALQQQMGLANNSSMIIVGSILSEISDNDLDNLKVIVGNTITTRKDVQFIFMTSKMATTSRALELLGQEIKDETVRLVNKYDEVLSHLIMAGSDIILCHSFHDPVLQVPLKALKYGAAPIEISASENRFRYFVDHDQETSKFSQFIKSTFGNMSLSQALDEMRNNPSKWNGKIVDAMSKDFSWDGECYDIHVSAYTAIKNM